MQHVGIKLDSMTYLSYYIRPSLENYIDKHTGGLYCLIEEEGFSDRLLMQQDDDLPVTQLGKALFDNACKIEAAARSTQLLSCEWTT